MTDLNALYIDLLERARKALPGIPDHPKADVQAQAAILLAETSNGLGDWNVARRVVNELTDPYEKAEKLEDIAKITQNSIDRLAALEAADEGDWNLDEDFSPYNISFWRSSLPRPFSFNRITREEIEGFRDDDRADMLEAYVCQLVNLGELEQAFEVTQSILHDEGINVSVDTGIRKRYWCRSLQAIAVGHARAGNFSQANIFVEQTSFVAYGYVNALVEIAGLVEAVIKEGRPWG